LTFEEKDFLKLQHIFAAVSLEIKRGRLRSVGMTEMARIIITKKTLSLPYEFELILGHEFLRRRK
jgi:hypothetical protein